MSPFQGSLEFGLMLSRGVAPGYFISRFQREERLREWNGLVV